MSTPLSAAGVLYALGCGLAGRPAVAAKMMEHDAMGTYMGLLRQASPAELVATAGHARKGHADLLWTIKELVESVQLGGGDLTAELLSCGYVDILVSALSAVEEVGAANVNGHMVVLGGMMLLKVLDGQALEQIEDKVRAAPATLRYLTDHHIAHMTDVVGNTSGSVGTIIAANLYGKDEGNSFGFARECSTELSSLVEYLSDFACC
jgi:hypothetical protein